MQIFSDPLNWHDKKAISHLLRKLPGWIQLKSLGDSKILRSSYFWTIFVPISAKVLSHLQNPLPISIGSLNISIPLSLPFSWKLFYFTSLAFAAASLVYSLTCPYLIRDYKKYSEFKEEGRGSTELFVVCQEFKRENPTYDEPTSGATVDALLSNFGVEEGKFFFSLTETKQGEIFHFVRNLLSQERPFFRTICVILYTLGLLQLAYLLYQNVCAVMGMIDS